MLYYSGGTCSTCNEFTTQCELLHAVQYLNKKGPKMVLVLSIVFHEDFLPHLVGSFIGELCTVACSSW